MRLLLLDKPELIELVAGWLGEYENYKWLDFGNGVQQVTPVTLKIMTQRPIHVLRAFTADDDELPIGVVGLTNVDRNFKTASIWCVLGNKRYGGLGSRAVSEMLTVGFTELGLEAINAWTVETNVGGRHVVERLHFTYIGRQRRCHYVDGRHLDRLLFDILATEHEGTSHAGPDDTTAANFHAVR
jgi:hypothetical protein